MALEEAQEEAQLVRTIRLLGNPKTSVALYAPMEHRISQRLGSLNGLHLTRPNLSAVEIKSRKSSADTGTTAQRNGVTRFILSRIAPKFTVRNREKVDFRCAGDEGIRDVGCVRSPFLISPRLWSIRSRYLDGPRQVLLGLLLYTIWRLK